MDKSEKKYIYREETEEEEYYDLANDPGETQNLSSLQSDEMREIKRRYFEFVSEFGQETLRLEESSKGVPAALREDLNALGYLD